MNILHRLLLLCPKCTCWLFCMLTLLGFEVKMNKTCACFTSHTSLTLRHGTNLSTDTTPDGKEQEAIWQSPPIRAFCMHRGIISNAGYLFSENLKTEEGDVCVGVHRIIIHRQNKSWFLSSLAVCLCNRFHLFFFFSRVTRIKDDTVAIQAEILYTQRPNHRNISTASPTEHRN